MFNNLQQAPGKTTGSLLMVLLSSILLLAACNRMDGLPVGDASPPAGEPQVVAATAVDAPAGAEAPVSTESPADATSTTDDGSPPETRAAADASAVGDAAQAPTATPEPTATPDIASGRVVLWHSYAGADGDALAALLGRLQSTYPDLTVETLFVAYDDLPQSYTDAVIAGGGPDLVAMPAWWLSDMVAAGAVQALDGLLDGAVVEGYFPAARASLERGDALYGLPLTYELVSLFVNQTLVEENALPATTADLLALAEAGPESGTGLYANLYHVAWGLPAYGAALLDDEGKVILDQGDGAAEFLTWLKELDETPAAYVDLDYGMLLDRFKKGEFAFFVDGPWAIDELRGALGEALAVTPLPAGPAGSALAWLSADGVLLNPNKDPEQQQRALLVAQALTDGPAGTVWAETARRLPAHQSATLGDDPLLAGFARQAVNAQPVPHQPEMAEIWGYGGDMLIKVLNDVMSPAAAVTEATALINDVNGKQ